jgi:hypothetical protein
VKYCPISRVFGGPLLLTMGCAPEKLETYNTQDTVVQEAEDAPVDGDGSSCSEDVEEGSGEEHGEDADPEEDVGGDQGSGEAGEDETESGDDEEPDEGVEPSEEDTAVQGYGPENSWYHVPLGEQISDDDCGWSQGQKICNFSLIDQYGDHVELYQFSGKVVVLDLFAEW